MGQLHKFFSLPPVERRLLPKSLLLVITIRLGLWLLPFHTLWHLLAFLVRRTKAHQVMPGDGRPPADRVAWSVKVASRYVPQVSCLVQALAVHTLLKQKGCPASLSLGVTKDEWGELQAHAWVACQGKIVIGGVQSASHFTPLPPLEKEVM